MGNEQSIPKENTILVQKPIQQKPKTIKISFVGQEKVGKTSLFSRYEKGTFNENYKFTSLILYSY